MTVDDEEEDLYQSQSGGMQTATASERHLLSFEAEADRKHADLS